MNLIKKIKEKFSWVKIQGFLRKIFFDFDYLIFLRKMIFLTNGKKLSVKRNGKRKKIKSSKPKITSCSILRQLYVKFLVLVCH